MVKDEGGTVNDEGGTQHDFTFQRSNIYRRVTPAPYQRVRANVSAVRCSWALLW
jgi:hypothetical protein